MPPAVVRFRLVLLAVLSAAALTAVADTGMRAPTAEEMKQLRLLDCTLESRSRGDCDVKAYGARAVFNLVPATVAGVLVLVSAALAVAFRYCCNCCGGRSQTMACFCACGSPKPLYARFNLWRAKLYAVALLVVCIVLFIVGVAGSAEAWRGLRGLADEAEGIRVTLDGQVDRIEAALVVRMYHQENDTEYDQNLMAKTGINVRDKADEVAGDIHGIVKGGIAVFRRIMDRYHWAPYLVFGFPLAVTVCGAVTALLNCRKCLPVTLLLVAALLGAAMWLLHGASSALAFAVGDVCAEVSGVVDGDLTVLKAATSCDDNLFSGFQSRFTDLENTAARQACEPIVEARFEEAPGVTVEHNVQAGRIFSVPPSASCPAATFASVFELTGAVATHQRVVDHFSAKRTEVSGAQGAFDALASDPSAPQAQKDAALAALAAARASLARASESLCTESMADPTVKCTMRMCAKTCLQADGTLSQSGRLAKFLTVTFQSAAKASTALDTIGADYTNCDAAFRLVVGGFEAPCEQTVHGFLLLRRASGAMAIVMTVFMMVMAMGAKRFAAYHSPWDESSSGSGSCGTDSRSSDSCGSYINSPY